MTPEDVSKEAHGLLAQAAQVADRIEDSDPQHAMANSALCYSAHEAADLALRAVCVFYDQPIPEDHDLGKLIDMLHPSLLRVPDQVQAARTLSHYSDGAGATGQAEPASSDECLDASVIAKNVVGWARVILRAGKTAGDPGGIGGGYTTSQQPD